MNSISLRTLSFLLFLTPAFLSAKEVLIESDPSMPPVVKPGFYGTPSQVGAPPSDAIVLFDGTNFDHWESTKGDKVKWKLVDNAMEVVRGTGVIQTKKKLGYGQYHVEWRTPEEVKGSGQGRGNSGFFPLSGPEVQVLDSYQNATYSHGQAGAVYNRYPPLVNACRAPGVWQTYDVIVHAPIQDKDGKYIRKSAYTVLHNGVLDTGQHGGGRVQREDRESKASGPRQSSALP